MIDMSQAPVLYDLLQRLEDAVRDLTLMRYISSTSFLQLSFARLTRLSVASLTWLVYDVSLIESTIGVYTDSFLASYVSRRHSPPCPNARQSSRLKRNGHGYGPTKSRLPKSSSLSTDTLLRSSCSPRSFVRRARPPLFPAHTYLRV